MSIFLTTCNQQGIYFASTYFLEPYIMALTFDPSMEMEMEIEPPKAKDWRIGLGWIHSFSALLLRSRRYAMTVISQIWATTSAVLVVVVVVFVFFLRETIILNGKQMGGGSGPRAG